MPPANAVRVATSAANSAKATRKSRPGRARSSSASRADRQSDQHRQAERVGVPAEQDSLGRPTDQQGAQQDQQERAPHARIPCHEQAEQPDERRVVEQRETGRTDTKGPAANQQPGRDSRQVFPGLGDLSERPEMAVPSQRIERALERTTSMPMPATHRKPASAGTSHRNPRIDRIRTGTQTARRATRPISCFAQNARPARPPAASASVRRGVWRCRRSSAITEKISAWTAAGE